MYQRKVVMDAEIVELVKEMNDLLHFVDSVEPLRNKPEYFTEIIQQVLKAIKECSESISNYLKSNGAGMNQNCGPHSCSHRSRRSRRPQAPH